MRTWAATAPFLLIFVGSVVLTFADLEATRVATAGFGYDILLALGAHLIHRDLPNIALATAGLVATAAAFWAYQRRNPAIPAR